MISLSFAGIILSTHIPYNSLEDTSYWFIFMSFQWLLSAQQI